MIRVRFLVFAAPVSYDVCESREGSHDHFIGAASALELAKTVAADHIAASDEVGEWWWEVVDSEDQKVVASDGRLE